MIKLITGDMLIELDKLDENSIDSIVTDPPYELNFMNKGWDNAGVSFNKETWQKCLRVLKPGGYLLAFGGSRTFHRIACAIEDAGFEIRDTIMWLYGSGFPKGMNIGLAVDKKNGVESKVVEKVYKGSSPLPGNHKGTWADNQKDGEYKIKEAQNKWQGWGTSLKPSFEPIIMARKPVEKTVINNVEKYGVGGINIDECRVGETGDLEELNKGRFPANTILTYDDTDYDEVCGGFSKIKNACRYFYCAKASKKDRDEGLNDFKYIKGGTYNFGIDGSLNGHIPLRKNIHPTVKPTELMQYLIRLVTPEGGIILDPFMGSGSTGKAAIYENIERNKNYSFIGIEKEEDYIEIAKARIEYIYREVKDE